MSTTIQEKLETMAANEQKVFDAGKGKGVYEWWDYYQTHQWLDDATGKATRSGDRISYGYAFAGIGWDDKNYNPIRDINATHASYDMFAHSGITDTKVAINIANPDKAGNTYNTFRNAAWLKTVRKFIINELQSMDGQFTNCKRLENLTIEGTIGRDANFYWCPLTRKSILGVFDHLGTPTTTQTLTFKGSAVDAAFEGGRTSDEWLALVAEAEGKNWSVGLYDA